MCKDVVSDGSRAIKGSQLVVLLDLSIVPMTRVTLLNSSGNELQRDTWPSKSCGVSCATANDFASENERRHDPSLIPLRMVQRLRTHCVQKPSRSHCGWH